MSTFITVVIFVGGPLLGALAVMATGRTRVWELILGAVFGTAIAWVAGREWSEYAAGEALRSGGTVARAAGLAWRDHLVTVAILAAFGALVGGLVAFIRRLIV